MLRVSLESGRLTLEGQIRIESLMSYRRELDAILPEDTDLTVDLKSLSVEDSSVLALLVYLVRRIRGAGKQISFEHPSEQLRGMAELAGLVDLIGLESP
ncbi:MAG: anti-anti-sigma factor [Candidatus Azotimanducaceae bacterium]|jgi:anti-anti-sigma factor